jgi:CMP-N,N'-diacetyllegionaminic acid synthase
VSEPKILGIIPARGGSKGVLKKNIKILNGRPLIQYSIDAAKKSKLLTDFVISTEDNEIRKIAINLNCPAPFKRPKNLSTDQALSIDVLKHAVKYMEKINQYKYDLVLMLQPTSPLRTYTDIDKSINLLIKNKSDSVISVTGVDGFHPLRMKRIINGFLVNYIDQGFEDMRPRQVLPKVYIRNGAIYLVKRDILFNYNSLVGNSCFAYQMPIERSVNLDCEADFITAEYFLKK